MYPFRTIISLLKQSETVHHQTPVMLIGSCFANNIGDKLNNFKFPVLINPFGVIYNPVSISNSLKILLDNKIFNEGDLFFSNNRWISFYHHTSFSDENQDNCLNTINNNITQSSEFLKTCRYLFITFGTARIYEFIKTGQIVSNCHKIPAKEFEQKLLTVEEIVDEYEILINRIIAEMPSLRIIFTLSPVRHWKDGATGNQLSKSILHLAIHQLINKFPSCINYFPGYEIVMDDLRDYRFYEADMLHPNQIAIDYIWELFSEAYFEPATIELNKQIDNIITACNHRPFNSESKEYKQFATTLVKKISDLTSKYPFLNFETEKKQFNKFAYNK